MASIILHKFIERIRGKFGEIIVKQRGGRAFISRPPDRTNVPPPTVPLRAARDRFTLAAAYATGAMRNPAIRAFYEQVAAKDQRPVFSVALTDFLKTPVVGLIETSAYRGGVGDKVTILATDDAEVVSVHVVIRAAGGAIVEQGPASNVDGPWIYTGTVALTVGQAVTFEVTATDRPGNIGMQTKGYTKT